MARNPTTSRWIAAGILAGILASAAWAVFSASGLRLETGGIELVMKASADHGLLVEFHSPNQPR